MMMRMILLSLSLAVITACATTGGPQAPQKSTRVVTVDGQQVSAEDAAQKVYDSAVQAREADDISAAAAGFERVLSEYGDTTWVDFATVALAQVRLDQERPADAQKMLEQLLLARPTSDAADQARYLLAIAQLEQGDAASAAPTLKNLVDKMDTPEEKRAAAKKLSEELYAQGQTGEAARYIHRAYELSDDDADKAARAAELLAIIDREVSFTDIRRLKEDEAQPGTLLDELLTFKLARIHLHLGDGVSAKEMLDHYVITYPAGQFYAEASALSQRLEQRVVVAKSTVGVLLPLSGRFEAHGKRVLSAILIGAGVKVPKDIAPGTFASKTVTFVVRDTQGDAQVASQAVEELVEKDHVIAIIGDILLDTALPIAQRADEYRVPVISLSRQEGVAELSPWAFRLSLTPRKQAAALARLSMEQLGHKRFAIVYPRHSYGVDVMNGFWDEVDKREGEVTAIESYAHDQTTFTAQAKSLVGRLNLEARGQYNACRSEANAMTDDYRRKKALEGCRDKVSPIVDFDALLIPDDFRTVSFIVPALVAEDLLVTNDAYTVSAYRKTTKGRSKPVQLLGPSLWNNPELGKRLGRQIDGALFVDGFSASSGRGEVKTFVSAFKKAVRSNPGPLDAHGRDAGALVNAVLGKGPTTRRAMQKELAAVKDFPGVTGLVGFDDKGDSNTDPIFFKIERGHSEIVENTETLGKGRG